MRQIVPINQNRAEAQHQHYLVAAPTQPYDPEAALINTIVSHLANLNDDEVVKICDSTVFLEGSDEDEHPENLNGW